MATRYGREKALELLLNGWTVKPVGDDEDILCGDPIMISPYDGKEYNPYEAEQQQSLMEYCGPTSVGGCIFQT